MKHRGLGFIVEHAGCGMEVPKVQYAAWFQEMGRDARPRREVGQPCQDAVRSVANVKTVLEVCA